MKYLILTTLIVFVTLKLVGIISWSWWLVFSPLIVYVGFYVLILALVGLAVAVGLATKNK